MILNTFHMLFVICLNLLPIFNGLFGLLIFKRSLYILGINLFSDKVYDLQILPVLGLPFS